MQRRMGDRAVYCARLESVCAARHQGFESPPIRHARPMRLFLSLLLAQSISVASAAENTIVIGDWIEVARKNFQAGDLNEAHAALDRADQSGKATAESSDLRGSVYLEQGNFAEAAKAFDAAREADPAMFAPKIHKGDLLLRQKKFREAREVYEALLKDTAVRLSVERLRYGVLIACLGERDEEAARSALERISFPTQTPAYYYAQAAWAFAHDKSSEARKWIGTAKQISIPAANAWFVRALYELGWVKEKPPPTIYQTI